MKTLATLAAVALTSVGCSAFDHGHARGPGHGAMAPGWGMMSQAERDAHHAKMRGFRGAGECEAYMQDHHKLMQQRAQQRGERLQWDGPRPYCDHLRKPA
jgi:hypothetical protein